MHDKQQRGTRGQIRVNGICEDHRHTHCRGSDKKRDVRIIGFDDFSGTDQQFAVMYRLDEMLQSLLDLPAEVMAVKVIDSAVHKTIAIRGADDGIDFKVEN